jgi:hypothetical protein
MVLEQLPLPPHMVNILTMEQLPLLPHAVNILTRTKKGVIGNICGFMSKINCYIPKMKQAIPLKATNRAKQPPTLAQKRATVAAYFQSSHFYLHNDQVESVFKRLIRCSGNYEAESNQLRELQQIKHECTRKLPPVATTPRNVKLLSLQQWYDMDASSLPDSVIDGLYKKGWNRPEVVSKRRQRLKQVTARINKLSKKISEYNNVNVVVPPQGTTLLYTFVPRNVFTLGEGGAYAHLTRSSYDKPMAYVKELDESVCSMGYLDIGGGLGVAGWHSVTKAYCDWAVNVEIDPLLCLQAAQLAKRALRSNLTSHRVALICGDIRMYAPPSNLGVVYCFDLAFWPDLYFDVLHWISRSTAKYVVTFKASREPSYYRDTLEILGAEEVQRFSQLSFSCSGESCTAILLRRTDTRPSTSDAGHLGSINDELVKRFLVDRDSTLKTYEALEKDFEHQIFGERENKSRTRFYRYNTKSS